VARARASAKRESLDRRARRAAPAEPSREAWITLQAKDHRASGSGGCNKISGSYQLTGNQVLSFGALAATRKACESGMDVESKFLAALEATRSYVVVGRSLELLDESGRRGVRRAKAPGDTETGRVPATTIHRILYTPLYHPDYEAIAEWPIITYHEGFTGRGNIDRTFADAGLAPDIVMSAMDTDVLKAYVELGLGVGIIAAMAFDPKRDAGLKPKSHSRIRSSYCRHSSGISAAMRSRPSSRSRRATRSSATA